MCLEKSLLLPSPAAWKSLISVLFKLGHTLDTNILSKYQENMRI